MQRENFQDNANDIEISNNNNNNNNQSSVHTVTSIGFYKDINVLKTWIEKILNTFGMYSKGKQILEKCLFNSKGGVRLRQFLVEFEREIRSIRSNRNNNCNSYQTDINYKQTQETSFDKFYD